MSSGDSAALLRPDRHGDSDALPGLVDFAVNVQPGPPPFVREALAARLGDLAAYPSEDDLGRAVAAVAGHHGVPADHVLPLNGAAEGFELLAKLRPSRAALIEPSFTEPARVLDEAGVRLTRVELPEPWRLGDAVVPIDADLVVVGNPTNPTSVLHPRSEIEGLLAPGRIVVVDEAFADLTLDADGRPEPESLAPYLRPGLIVIRSITKTFGLAGLRAGYLLADPETIDRLTVGRRHWPLDTLVLTALAESLGPAGLEYSAGLAQALRDDRVHLVAALREAGIEVPVAPQAPYVLVRVPDGLAVKAALAERGFAVRSCANFTGLTTDFLRLAVRPPDQADALVAAMQDVVSEMSGRTR